MNIKLEESYANCGTNRYFHENRTIHFVVNGD